MRRALLVLVGLAVAGLGVLALLPSPIDAVAYAPPPAPALTGPLAPNELLRATELLAEGRIHGPEDVAVDAEGRLYAATADGSGLIQRLDADGTPRDFASTGGRPLGLRFAPGGSPALPGAGGTSPALRGAGGTSLIVCDSSRGLLSIDPEGHVTVLASEAEGVPFRFTNNLDVAHDGTVYFSDSSTRFGQADYLYDLFEARPSGRLLRYDPAAGKATVLLRDLFFANGVALSRDESFVLVNETYRYRTTRYWLKGPKGGTSDVFLDNLPGFPDNLDGNRKGTFCMALFTVRNPIADTLHPHPWAKNLIAKLPRFLWPRPAPYCLVLEIDETGRILRSLQDPGGQRVRHVTTAREHDGKLYVGSLDQAWIGRLPLPAR